MNDLTAPAGAQFSLAPRTLSEAMDFAKMMAESELVPKHFRGKPADVLIAVQMGAEIGLAPMAAIQNVAVINGKPGMYGDAGKAVLLANGCIIDEDDVPIVKQQGFARCKITRKGRPPVERTFSEADAKTAGLWNKEGPWRTYPYRQMAWRAFWFAARDAAADLLKGLGGAEELADVPMRDMGAAEVVERAAPALPDYSAEAFEKNFPAWQSMIQSGKKSADSIIAMLRTKAVLSAEQEGRVRAIGNAHADAHRAADAALAAQEGQQ